MSLYVFVIGISIVLITLILLVTVVSPDHWTNCCGNCGICCGTCGTSCDVGSGSSRGDPNNGNKGHVDAKNTMLETDKGVKHVVVFNEKGEIDNDRIVEQGLRQRVQRLAQTPDLYSSLQLPVWNQYWQAKQEAEKNVFVPQRTSLIYPPKWLQRKNQKKNS
jgi:hypothetical protein